MDLIDTHTHLFTEEFDGDRKEVIERAIETGITKMCLPAIDSSSFKTMLNTQALYPDNIYLMSGLHPCSVGLNYKEELKRITEFIEKNEVVAIGETGLDYHWDTTYIQQQKESLHRQCELAIQYNKPIVLHTRDSVDDAIAIIEEYTSKGIRGVFHCFSGTLQQANKIIDMGFYLGIGGVLTFKNSKLSDIVEVIDLKHIVLETDSPYLAPTPHRGKRNESAYIKLIAEKLSEVKSSSLEEIASITSKNARLLYNI